jgi:gas vesicle protein
MKELIIFIAGMAVGASVALLLAPESGEELRADIRTKADEELLKLQGTMARTNERLNQLETDLKQSLNRS